MSTIFIVVLLLACAFVATSVVLSRMTQKVQSAPDSEYLELEGNWIRYRVTGGGPPVVLVHGWLSSGRIWERLADRLAQRFTVYTLDLSGFGDSDKPVSGYGVRYGSRLLYAFCAHFGLTRSAVVGHDVGGTMAVKLAADHSDVVGRLVLVATPAAEDQIDLPTFLWLATLPVVGPIFYTLGRFIRPLRGFWMRSFVLDPEDLTEEVVEDAGKSTPAAVQKTFAVMRREISRGRLVRQAGVVKVPVLVIAGEGDQVVDPQATEDWARTLSAEVVLLNDCGHLPMLERPGEFNAQVLTFLTGDSGYLDLVAEPPEEMEDVAVSETLEESLSPTGAEP
ncbi:MAG: alpha/beta hydrolase, partial [Actinomycetota bacterium]|nr:alpha/beta hydrolase [Actinomycetota bacterium]